MMRLITCSNSAPRIEVENGRIVDTPVTPSGLVPILTALLREMGGHWIFTAASPSSTNRNGPITSAMANVSLHPLMLDEGTLRLHREEISIKTLLWLFHYLHDTSQDPIFDKRLRSAWEAYREINQAFARALVAAHENSSEEVVLVNDFHLMLVPSFFAEAALGRSSRLVYFHHVPWCDPDYFGILPYWLREQLLESLLQSDVVGFHSRRWADAFVACCGRFLPTVKIDGPVITYHDHVTAVAIMPGPIDMDTLDRLRGEPATEQWCESLVRRASGRRMIVRVDRLDLWKNLIRGFSAYEALLARVPHLAADLWFCAIVTPPRLQTDRHRRYQAICETAVSRINERYGARGEAVSLVYPNGIQSPRNRAVAALTLSSATLVNPTWDGLNMVAKETLVVGNGSPLLLSVNAGVYDQLSSIAIPVHPFDEESTTDALACAVNTDRGNASQHIQRNRTLLQNENARLWLDALLLATPGGSRPSNLA